MEAIRNFGIYKNKQTGSSIVFLKISNETSRVARSIADYFNIFFTNIAANLIKRFPVLKIDTLQFGANGCTPNRLVQVVCPVDSRLYM